MFSTYIFDIGASVHGDNVAVLNTEVVAHDTVDAGAPVVQIVIGQDNQDSVLPFLALHQDCITSEELEGLHGVVRQSDNRVVIIDGIRHAVDEVSASIRRVVKGDQCSLTSTSWVSSSS